MKRNSTLLVGIFLLVTVMLAGQAVAQDCVEPPAGLIAWWPGDGNTDDVFAGHDGTILGGMGFAPGIVGDAFHLDGLDDGVEVPNTGGVFDVTRFTIAAWVFPEADGGRPIVWKQSRVGNFNTSPHCWESPWLPIWTSSTLRLTCWTQELSTADEPTYWERSSSTSTWMS